MTDKDRIVRLTQLSSKAGWASKIGPMDLMQVLHQLKNDKDSYDPNLLVGFDTADDAGVYRISESMALIQTVDFFTPVVDNPYVYGQIAAANALSDIYAMGGEPLTALNIVCFPCSIGTDILAEILKGGADKIRESGARLLGGHTVTDNEPKYGLSVTGTVHPDRITTNAGSRPGDVLILTKPLGTGIITTAFKYDDMSEQELEQAVYYMSMLNKDASRMMQQIGVHAATDITGFGLLGHSFEMAQASGTDIQIFSSQIPLMEQVEKLVQMEDIPGGARENAAYLKNHVTFSSGIPEYIKWAAFDPQTSGGLLIAVPPEKAYRLILLMNQQKIPNWMIGEVVQGTGDIQMKD